MPSPIIKGLTTIKWGSTGAVASGAMTSAIVVRASYTDKNGAAIEIEDNDGFDASVEVVYDSAIAWPAPGDTVSLRRPRDAAPVNCLLAAYDDSVERKKEGMLTLKLHYRPGVTL